MKNSGLNVSKFSSGLVPFKLGKKNKLSEFFSARFWDSCFYVYKEMFSMNFHQIDLKQQKAIV